MLRKANAVLCVAVAMILSSVKSTARGSDNISTDVGWRLLAEGDFSAGLDDPLVPVKRYGAMMFRVPSTRSSTSLRVAVVSGYLFDARRMAPIWLDDWWERDVSLGTEDRWEQVDDGGSVAAVLGGGRYKAAHTSVISEGSRWLGVVFGGGSVNSKTVLGDMFLLDFDLHRVQQVTIHHGPDVPSPRQGAALLPAGTAASLAREGHGGNTAGGPLVEVLLYGGLLHGGTLDEALYHGTIHVVTQTCEWTRVPVHRRTGGGGGAASLVPLPRRSFLMVRVLPSSSLRRAAIDDTADVYVVFGGFSSNPKNMNDVWMVVIGQATNNPVSPHAERKEATWSLLHDGGGFPTNAPPPRGGHVGAGTDDALYIALGAACDWECTTFYDTWRFSYASRTWTKIVTNLAATPVGRQFASYVGFDDALVVFGGESFRPYSYWNDLWLLAWSEERTWLGDSLSAPGPADDDLLRQPSASHRGSSDDEGRHWFTAGTIKGNEPLLQHAIRAPGSRAPVPLRVPLAWLTLQSNDGDEGRQRSETRRRASLSVVDICACFGFMGLVLLLRKSCAGRTRPRRIKPG